ncbi:MAG: hypothetical protein V3T14_06940, partial [Myxococcota bacterium]
MGLILETIVPVFTIIGLGFWLAGRRELHIATLADLALLVTSPALVFSILAETVLEPDRWVTLLGGTVWITLGTGLVAGLYVRLSGGGLRGLVPPAVFWNAGNMGLPCARLAFGPEGLEAAVIIFVTIAVLQFSAGVWIAKGRGGFLEVLRLPLIYAAGLGLALGASGVRPPQMLMEPVRMLGQMA